MKKNRIIIFALIVFFVISVISIGLNIRHSSEQDRIRRNIINQAYSALINISNNLDELIKNIEIGETDYETNQQSLIVISHYFVRLDILLKQYSTQFPPPGIVRNSYVALFDFDFISYTLTVGAGTANDMPYCGITNDGVISEKEVRYLVTLRDDIDVLIAAMVSSENPPNENQNLTTSQIDNILNTFFSKWSFHNDDSPYFLLRSE